MEISPSLTGVRKMTKSLVRELFIVNFFGAKLIILMVHFLFALHYYTINQLCCYPAFLCWYLA